MERAIGNDAETLFHFVLSKETQFEKTRCFQKIKMFRHFYICYGVLHK